MLSGNPNLTSTSDPSSTHFVISSKNITHLLGMILLFGTHAEKGLLIFVL